MKSTLIAFAVSLLCFGNSALADTIVKWNGIAAQLPVPDAELAVANTYYPPPVFIWTGGGSATLNLTTGSYQFQVKYISLAQPVAPYPIGAPLSDGGIQLQAVFVCDSLNSGQPVFGPVTFNLDKTGSANIQGVVTNKSDLPICAQTKEQVAFLIVDSFNNYYVYGTGRQMVTSTQNNQK